MLEVLFRSKSEKDIGHIYQFCVFLTYFDVTPRYMVQQCSILGWLLYVFGEYKYMPRKKHICKKLIMQ